MSAVGGKADVLATWAESPFLAISGSQAPWFQHPANCPKLLFLPHSSQGHPVSEEGVERRLTTILAADVVGYSRLMGEDEVGTLAALKAHRKELIEPKAAQYHGRTIKLMGDGALMEFPSVVEAVTFAVELAGEIGAIAGQAQ